MRERRSTRVSEPCLLHVPSSDCAYTGKLFLVNEMRLEYEQRRGLIYSGVVRTRPDIAYGAAVPLLTASRSVCVLVNCERRCCTCPCCRLQRGRSGAFALRVEVALCTP